MATDTRGLVLQNALGRLRDKANQLLGRQQMISPQPIRQPNQPQQFGMVETARANMRQMGQNLAQAGRNIVNPSLYNQNFKALNQNLPAIRNFYDKNPISQRPIAKTLQNISLNSGQPFLSGMSDITNAANNIRQAPIGSIAKTAVGVGKMAAPISSLYQGANIISSSPQMGSRDITQRLASGFVQGMSQTPNVATNVPDKNINVPIVGPIDPVKTVGDMVGYVKNPLNQQIFKGTERFIPTQGSSMQKWILTTSARGGLENALLAMADINPEDSVKDRALKVLKSVPEGVIQEIIGQGISSGIGAAGKNRVSGKVSERVKRGGRYTYSQLAKVADQLNEFSRWWYRPVKTMENWGDGTRKVITNGQLQVQNWMKSGYDVPQEPRNLSRTIKIDTGKRLNEAKVFTDSMGRTQIKGPKGNRFVSLSDNEYLVHPADINEFNAMLPAGITGMSAEKDENGNYKVTFDPGRAAVGMAVAGMVQNPKSLKEIITAGTEGLTKDERAKVKLDEYKARGEVFPGNELPRKLPWDNFKPKSNTTSNIDVVPREALTGTGIDRTKLTGVQLNKASEDMANAFQKKLGGVPKDLAKEMPFIYKNADNKQKVNIIDFIRTPDRVLKKLGLGEYAKLLQKKQSDYLDQLPKEIDKVNNWYKAVKGSSNSSQNIFRWLDGKNDVVLSEKELKVAEEIKQYLADWADKLRLPKDKRIANYITHIFEPDLMTKNFDEDLAKIIHDKLPGEVYDPFLQQRLGEQGYVEDVFKALDAYVKRATRKYNMDQALTPLSKKIGKTAEESTLDLKSWQYVKNYIDRVNMRPTTLDSLLDDFVKTVPGGKRLGQRPTAAVTRKLRRWVYRGTLGLNFNSAIKNLTQGVNTYSQLGEWYTGLGYVKAFRALVQKDPELERVLANNQVQDRTLSAMGKFTEKFDKGLFFMFDLAERINRGTAYYGAKAKGLAEGMTEPQAIDYANEMVSKTQFTFGAVDTPVALQGDLVKTIAQFQSYNVKQAEFIVELLQSKKYANIARFVGANAALIMGLGSLFGIDEWQDVIPFSNLSNYRASPIPKAVGDVFAVAMDAPDKYGNKRDWVDKAKLLGNDVFPFVPAGIQAKKAVQGMNALEEGAVKDSAGRTKFNLPKDTRNEIGLPNSVTAPLMGIYSTPEGKEYLANKSGENNGGGLWQYLTGFFVPDKSVSAAEGYDVFAQQAALEEQKKLDKKAFEPIKKLYEDPNVPMEDKRQAAIKAGLDPRTVETQIIAGFDNEIKSKWIKNILDKGTVDNGKGEMVPIARNGFLLNLRIPRNGEKLLTDNLINDMVKSGDLDKYTATLLKNSEWDEQKQRMVFPPEIYDITEQQKRYYDVASLPEEEKLNYIAMRIGNFAKSKDRQGFLQFLALGRRPLANQTLVSQKLLSTLRKQNLITSKEYTQLYNMKFDRDGNIVSEQSSSGGSGRKAKSFVVNSSKVPGMRRIRSSKTRVRKDRLNKIKL